MKDLKGWVGAFFGQFQFSLTGRILPPGWLMLLLVGLLWLCAPSLPIKICGGAYTAAALVMAVRGTRQAYGLSVDHRDWIAGAEGLLLLAAHVQLIVGGARAHNRFHLALGVVLTAITAFFLFVFFALRWDGRKRPPK